MTKLTINDPHNALPDPNRPSRQFGVRGWELNLENLNSSQHANYLCH